MKPAPGAVPAAAEGTQPLVMGGRRIAGIAAPLPRGARPTRQHFPPSRQPVGMIYAFEGSCGLLPPGRKREKIVPRKAISGFVIVSVSAKHCYLHAFGTETTSGFHRRRSEIRDECFSIMTKRATEAAFGGPIL